MYAFIVQNFILLVKVFCDNYLLLYKKGVFLNVWRIKNSSYCCLSFKRKTQTWLAEELKMNQGYLSRILNGQDDPEEQIERIKTVLGIENKKEEVN